MAEPKKVAKRSLADASIAKLGLSPEVEAKLREIHAEVDGHYREAFADMAQAMARQSSALDRLQRTVELLVEAVRPDLAARMPAVLRVASDGEQPDVASVTIGDPVGLGYTLSQAALAEAVGVSSGLMSQLCKVLKLSEDGKLAMVVRRGRKGNSDLVNYHPRAIAHVRDLIAKPPKELEDSRAIKRAREEIR